METVISSTAIHNRMYQIINNEITEVVRHGDELLPVTDPRTSQIIGQLVLDIWGKDENSTI
jgi:hypothetical protein